MSNKFKFQQIVTFKDDKEKYKIVRAYQTDTGYKYDVLSLDGKRFIIAMPQEKLTDNDLSFEFPKGMEEELIRLGKKKKDEET